ncbi:MAG TPA: putative zinc-binding peptidase [Xanthobacteraceae bacterium]|nr:putative zinc-binding peptidase [Xanthobacteraceae bacterium]
MKLFKCQNCGQLLYFENDLCVKCSHRLGFIPEITNLSALELAENAGPGIWRALAIDNKFYRSCANAEFGVCNWMIDAESADVYCAACRHNRTVPDTRIPGNVVAWRKIELAKHMLFYTLMKLRLPCDEKDNSGKPRLRFDFLASPPHQAGPRIMTGHDNGLITLAIEEADDAEREKRRTIMHEPYRTLVGHFRHEVGHYYWDILVRDGGHVEACRGIFGDETVDYDGALKAYYADGAPPGWQDNFISAYATSHPWEDFAETWAHYLHIVDALEMARAFGMYVNPRLAEPGELDAHVTFDPYLVREPSPLIETWIPLSNALNSLNRTMGLPDIYPFILSPPVVEKLSAIHDLIHGNALPAKAAAGATASDKAFGSGAGTDNPAPDKSAA